MKYIFLLLILVFTTNVQAVSEELVEAINNLKDQNVEYKYFLERLLPKTSYERLRSPYLYGGYFSPNLRDVSEEIFRLYFDIQPSLETLIPKDLENLKYISRFPDPNRSSILDPQFEPLLQELADIEFSNLSQITKNKYLTFDSSSFFRKRLNNFERSFTKMFITRYVMNSFLNPKSFSLPYENFPNYYEKTAKLSQFMRNDDFNLLSGFNFEECNYNSFKNYLSGQDTSLEVPLAILIGKIENYAWIASDLFHQYEFVKHMITLRIQHELKYLAWKD
jgi:hypothetical protein